jgi:alpha-tubulin suppressor-like RCC1 family protein
MDNIWGWGVNDGGISWNRLLSPTGTPATSSSSPAQASYTTDHKFTKIYNCYAGSGTSSNAMGIKANGTLWGWGNNGAGELGLGDTTARTSPVQVGASTNWLKVSGSGNGYSHMLRTDGVLFGTGYNLTWTMLGDGTNTSRSSPVQIGTGFSDIMNGYSHSIACKSDGTLWSWGAGLFGSLLGDGVTYTWSGNFNDGTGSRNYPLQIASGGFNSAGSSSSSPRAARIP